MPKLKHSDIRLLDDIFDMAGGYVLQFSNKTLAEFFDDELQIDIYDQRYAGDGTSKANRVRCFLKNVDAATAVRTLQVLWREREDVRARDPQPDKPPNAEARYLDLLDRLQGKPGVGGAGPIAAGGVAPVPTYDPSRVLALRQAFLALHSLAPLPRGFAFEKWLKDFADAYRLDPRAAFKLVGEQIDGSFLLHHETYLLEAKWQLQPCNLADLRGFNAKVEDKMAWSRGLFLSYYGFSDEALEVFKGGGKKIILMNGRDVWDMLGKQLPFGEVLARKVRVAGETGRPFVPVSELFAGPFDDPPRATS